MTVSGPATTATLPGGATLGRPALSFLLAAAIYAVLLVYASLVPFSYQEMELAEAWRRFRDIPFLTLGPESRADWIANLVAFAPLGFLLAASPGAVATAGERVFAAIGGIAICLALALAIEFVQVFFAPRTVSLNDLAAEALGSGLGVVAGTLGGARATRALATLFRGGRPALRVVLAAYALAYLAMSLFPFDFVIDGEELRHKLAVGAGQLWSLPGVERTLVHAGAALGAAVVAMMPIGALVARTGLWRAAVPRALLLGLLFGALVEGLQMLLLSGVSDVASAVARGFGAALGAIALRVLRQADLPRLRRWARPLALPVLPLYLTLLAVVNDLAGGGWVGAEAAGRKLAELRFLPFYYHYFTSEAVAFVSVVTRVAMYAPLGGLVWLWRRPQDSLAGGAALAAVLACVAAFVCEGLRLFKPELRPDPTNVWIAAAAAGGAYAVLTLGWRWLVRPPAPTARAADAPNAGAADPARVAPARPAIELAAHWPVALIPAAAAALGIAGYPLAPFWLGLGVLVYAALLWRWPWLWLVLLPALLPSIDLAPWSGRFYFDEGDFLVLATAAVLFARQPVLRESRMSRAGLALVLLLTLAHLLAALKGVLPLEPIGRNAFNSYMSPYNALRVARGFGWALLLLPALAFAMAEDRAAALRRLGLGLALGLAAVSLVAVRERLVFTDLMDFETPFRITATFSSMHLGGGSIAAFLALTLPFLALPFVVPAPLWHRLFAAGLLVLAGYVLLVTFNRAAYLGAAAGFVVLLATLPAALARRPAAWPGGRRAAGLAWLAPIAGLAALAGVIAVVLSSVLPGSFAAERFQKLGNDFETRLWQWREGLALADTGPLAALIGSGLGSYPRNFLLRNIDGPLPTTFAIAAEDGRQYLHLGSGESLYFGQRVAAEAGARYRLSLSLRSAAAKAELLVPICEKTLLYSFRCTGARFTPEMPGRWETHEIELVFEEIGRAPGALGRLAARPVELALYNAVPGTTLDIDDVSLAALDGAAAGRELLANGGFEAGSDFWFFAADNLSIWRIENMALMTLYEQGWLGLVALLLAVAGALVAGLRAILAGRPGEAGAAAVLLAGLAGFLVVGIAHGLVDAPRPMALFWIVLFAALALATRPAPPRRPAAADTPAGAGTEAGPPAPAA